MDDTSTAPPAPPSSVPATEVVRLSGGPRPSTDVGDVSDPALVDACGEDPSSLCEWVFDRTDNETVATVVDWLVGRPLAIVSIVVAALVVRRVARWLVRRAVRRMMLPPDVVRGPMRTAVPKQLAGPLARLGVSTNDERTIDEIALARRRSRADSIGSALASTATVVVWIAAIVAILTVLGVNVGALFAGAGILGLALGFGSQSLVRDCINGLFMLIEDQYGIGDVVDVGAASGVVERITLRTTVLRGADGTVWHVPNGEILRVGNRSQQWSVAIVDVEVALATDLDLAQRLLADVARRVCDEDAHRDQLLGEPEVLGVESMTGDGVTLRLQVKTRPGKQWGIQRVLRERIKEEFGAQGIEMPVRRWAGGATPGA
jgi:small-conductance mechanosensitive channel